MNASKGSQQCWIPLNPLESNGEVGCGGLKQSRIFIYNIQFYDIIGHEIEPMGESPRTLLQRGLAYVESWPIADSCRTASHRHHHLKGSQPAGSCRRTIRQSFFLGSKKGFGSTVRPPAGVRSPSWLDHRASRVRGWFRPEWTSPQADKTFGRPENPGDRGRASRPVPALRHGVGRGRA